MSWRLRRCRSGVVGFEAHGHACQFLPGGINSSLREAEAERRLQEEEARPNRLEKVAERVPKYPFRWNRHIVERGPSSTPLHGAPAGPGRARAAPRSSPMTLPRRSGRPRCQRRGTITTYPVSNRFEAHGNAPAQHRRAGVEVERHIEGPKAQFVQESTSHRGRARYRGAQQRRQYAGPKVGNFQKRFMYSIAMRCAQSENADETQTEASIEITAPCFAKPPISAVPVPRSVRPRLLSQTNASRVFRPSASTAPACSRLYAKHLGLQARVEADGLSQRRHVRHPLAHRCDPRVSRRPHAQQGTSSSHVPS